MISTDENSESETRSAAWRHETELEDARDLGAIQYVTSTRGDGKQFRLRICPDGDGGLILTIDGDAGVTARIEHSDATARHGLCEERAHYCDTTTLSFEG